MQHYGDTQNGLSGSGCSDTGFSETGMSGSGFSASGLSGGLSIGTVAKLTGISVHTLRAWEKRHQVVRVVRSDSGRRLYSPADVQRLKRLRQLTAAGHSIGNVAGLDDHQLEKMLDFNREESQPAQAGESRIPVCLYSERPLDTLVINENNRRFIDIQMQINSIDVLLEKLKQDKVFCTVLVIDTLQKQQLRFLRQLITFEPQHKYYVVFSFAQREVIDELNTLGFLLIRAPITVDQLFGKVVESYQSIGAVDANSRGRHSAMPEVPPHKFTRRQLELMANIGSAIDCECPKHIAELIRSLTLFEGYSQHCASVTVEDAHLHNEIYKLTAQARSQMERAISLVMEAENINLASLNA